MKLYIHREIAVTFIDNGPRQIFTSSTTAHAGNSVALPSPALMAPPPPPAGPILSLSLFLFLFTAAAALSAAACEEEKFTEELLLRPLPDRKALAHFYFRSSAPPAASVGRHHHLFPKAISQLVRAPCVHLHSGADL
jgi:hypothetical protein